MWYCVNTYTHLQLLSLKPRVCKFKCLMSLWCGNFHTCINCSCENQVFDSNKHGYEGFLTPIHSADSLHSISVQQRVVYLRNNTPTVLLSYCLALRRHPSYVTHWPESSSVECARRCIGQREGQELVPHQNLVRYWHFGEPAGLGLAQGPLLCGSPRTFENIRRGEIPFTFLSLYSCLLVIG
jgi:hypothetical protein